MVFVCAGIWGGCLSVLFVFSSLYYYLLSRFFVCCYCLWLLFFFLYARDRDGYLSLPYVVDWETKPCAIRISYSHFYYFFFLSSFT